MRENKRHISRLMYINNSTDDLFTGKFNISIQKLVGSGFSGSVFKCKINHVPELDINGNSEERLIAIKVIDKAKVKAQAVENEVRLLSQVEASHVVQYISAAESIDAYWIITEFCGRGDLHGILRDLDKSYIMARSYFLGVLAGLESLHDKRIAHCDIKMKNILITDNDIPKLADFGFAKQYSSINDMETICQGTKDYWAPEMFVPYPTFNPFKADLYALGVTFVGVCEKHPIKRKHDDIQAIVNQFKAA